MGPCTGLFLAWRVTRQSLNWSKLKPFAKVGAFHRRPAFRRVGSAHMACAPYTTSRDARMRVATGEVHLASHIVGLISRAYGGIWGRCQE